MLDRVIEMNNPVFERAALSNLSTQSTNSQYLHRLIRGSSSRRFPILTVAALAFGCSTAKVPTISVTGSPAMANHVCIEVNDSAPTSNILFNLEIALHDEGISSILYSRGAEGEECKTTLEYSIKTGHSDDPTSVPTSEYWTSVDLDVLQDHMVVAIARYEANGTKSRSISSISVNSMIRSLIRPMHSSRGNSESSFWIARSNINAGVSNEPTTD